VWPEPILHVDMDSFFVEVERLADASLRGIPVAVGGSGRRGVIASASYEARRFGVHSAQPTATALRMCPELRVVAPSHDRYSEVSAAVFEVFRSYTPVVEGLSLDEAFLDVGGLRLHLPSAVAVGESVRKKLRDDLGLPASVGIASVKFIAKLASKAAKPDDVFHVPAESQKAFLADLGAESMWGVGPATLAALERLGVETIGDIATMPVETLVSALGPTNGRHLHDLANGIDPRAVVPDAEAKSVSVEETYPYDLETRNVMDTSLLGLAQRLSSRLRVSGLRCRTLTLKLRKADFTTVTRSTTAETAFDGSRQIYGLAVGLLDSIADPRAVRLLGLGGTSLESASEPVQRQLDADEDWERVEDSVAEVQARFGAGSVGPARLLKGRISRNRGEEPR
jgi:DNA polymerase-4